MVPCSWQTGGPFSLASDTIRSRAPPVVTDQICGISIRPAVGRRSARNSIRPRDATPTASTTSVSAGVRRRGRTPLDVDHTLRNSSRTPTPSARHARSVIRRAVGSSRSPTTNRGRPLPARRITQPPSGSHSAPRTSVAGAGMARGAPPEAGMTYGRVRPVRSLRNSTERPSGEIRGCVHESVAAVSGSGAPPSSSTRHKRIRYRLPRIVRRS